MLPSPPKILYRRINPDIDGDLCAVNHHAACVASFGNTAPYSGKDAYVRWLASRVEEFPDGHVLAHLDDGRFVGQLELQVPYGRTTGYVNLFYVAPDFRGLGFGRRMHEEFAERYFRSWEADRIELHVSPTNHRAVRFYRLLGFKWDGNENRMWRMAKDLRAVPKSMITGERGNEA